MSSRILAGGIVLRPISEATLKRLEAAYGILNREDEVWLNNTDMSYELTPGTRIIKVRKGELSEKRLRLVEVWEVKYQDEEEFIFFIQAPDHHAIWTQLLMSLLGSSDENF